MHLAVVEARGVVVAPVARLELLLAPALVLVVRRALVVIGPSHATRLWT
jgi:hypothetical protein